MKKAFFLSALISLLSMSSISYGQSTIMIFGDSLSNGHQLSPGQSWGSLLQQCINNMHAEVLVVNESQDNLDTQQGLETLAESLTAHHPDIVIVALGTVDAQVKQPATQVRNNIQQMIDLIHEYEAKTILAATPIANQQYQSVFADIAHSQRVLLIKDLYADLKSNRPVLLEDGIHANSRGQKTIMNTVWKSLYSILEL